jgi:hypothetical protein
MTERHPTSQARAGQATNCGELPTTLLHQSSASAPRLKGACRRHYVIGHSTLDTRPGALNTGTYGVQGQAWPEAEPVRHDQGMPVTGWFGRLPGWVHIANIVVCSAVVVGGLVSGHTATAVWFGGLAVLAAWGRIRRRRIERRLAQQNPSQMVDATLRVLLGFDIVFLGTAVFATIIAVQGSGGDRTFSAVSAGVLYACGAVMVFCTVRLWIARPETR